MVQNAYALMGCNLFPNDLVNLNAENYFPKSGGTPPSPSYALKIHVFKHHHAHKEVSNTDTSICTL